MATQVQFRGGTTSEHSSFNGAAREVTVDTTKQTLVVQDGTTDGGFPLLREKNPDDLKVKFGTNDDLEIFHSGDDSIISNTTNNNFIIRNIGNNDLTIKTQNSYPVTIKTNNEDAIVCTANGSVALHHDGGTAALETTATGVKITSSGSSHGLTIYKGSNVAAYLGHIGSGDEGQLSLKNGGNDTIVLNGETGAGTFNGNITITNTQPKLFLTDTNNTSDFSIQNENGNLNFYDETNSASRLRIISTGDATFGGKHVQINGTPVWSVSGGDYGNLSVRGTTAASSGFINLGNGAAATNDGFDLARIKIHNGATEVARITGITGDGNNDSGELWFATQASGGSLATRLVVDKDGLCGIGTTSPDRMLHIEGVVPYFRFTDTNENPDNGETNGMIEFETRDSNNPGVANNIRSELVDNTNGASTLYFSAGTPTTIGTKMEIQHGGDVKINNGNLVIGTGGKGIDFSAQQWTTATGANTDSELLDHYEEGTWAPVLNKVDVSGTIPSYSHRYAHYVRVGKMLWISFYLQINSSSWGTGNGRWYISGLPFNVESGTNAGYQSIPIGYFGIDGSEINQTTDQARLQANGQGGNHATLTMYGSDSQTNWSGSAFWLSGSGYLEVD